LISIVALAFSEAKINFKPCHLHFAIMDIFEVFFKVFFKLKKPANIIKRISKLNF